MKRFITLALVATAALSLGACVKVTNTAEVKNDASMTITLDVGYKLDAFESMLAMMEQVLSDQMGDEVDDVLAKFDELEAMFDEATIKSKMKEIGIDVTSVTPSNKGGWKGAVVKGAVQDVNVWLEKLRVHMQKEMEKAEQKGGMPFQLPDVGQLTTRFLKTEDAGIGELVLIPSLTKLFEKMDENPLSELEGMLEDLDESDLEMIEQQMDYFKGMFSIDELSVDMTIVLPGPIVSTTGCKKVGENGAKMTLSGSAINLDGVKGLFGLKNGVSARFKIPEGCKIKFHDRPVAGGTTPKVKTEGKQDQPKKGGLKTGDEGDGDK